MQGKFEASAEVLAAVRRRSKNPSWLALADVQESFHLRARENFNEALEVLDRVSSRYPDTHDMRAYAEIQKAFILCQLGLPGPARKALSGAEALAPWYIYFHPGQRSLQFYVPEFAEGKFAAAAEILLNDSRAHEAGISDAADRAAKAGILFELAGDCGRAKEVWSDTARRFPSARCCFFGGLAQSFLSGEADSLEDMPHHGQARSEMFYLAGRLYDCRGKTARAQELYELSWKQDPTLKWPAYLSKKRLAA
jgi:tetratricopeptide (TPR) repeat protein